VRGKFFLFGSCTTCGFFARRFATCDGEEEFFLLDASRLAIAGSDNKITFISIPNGTVFTGSTM